MFIMTIISLLPASYSQKSLIEFEKTNASIFRCLIIMIFVVDVANKINIIIVYGL